MEFLSEVERDSVYNIEVELRALVTTNHSTHQHKQDHYVNKHFEGLVARQVLLISEIVTGFLSCKN